MFDPDFKHLFHELVFCRRKPKKKKKATQKHKIQKHLRSISDLLYCHFIVASEMVGKVSFSAIWLWKRGTFCLLGERIWFRIHFVAICNSASNIIIVIESAMAETHTFKRSWLRPMYQMRPAFNIPIHLMPVHLFHALATHKGLYFLSLSRCFAPVKCFWVLVRFVCLYGCKEKVIVSL